MRVRLDCAKQEDCLPFYVAVRWPQENAAQTSQASLTRPLAAIVPASTAPKTFTVRAGSQATLLLDGDHIHIRISVVCLENGVTGQTIRVSSKDHQKTFTAEVVDGTVLRGSL
jgi:flagella basal body P-ring formation protein FlgA